MHIFRNIKTFFIIIRLGLGALLLLALAAHAGAKNAAGWKLRSLKDFSVKHFAENTDSARVLVLFQSRCPACSRQIQNLKCLKNQAQVDLIGVFSPEKDLRKEYKRLNTVLPAFYGDKGFRNRFKIDPDITPQILVLSPQARILNLGFTPCSKILEQLKTQI